MKLEIAKLMERIQSVFNWERAAVAGRDCLLEWEQRGDAGLRETIEAWNRFADEKERGDGHSDTTRHGAWVPAIPL
jgi:hypothetical protein